VLMIRLSRRGARKQPHYRIVVIEKDRARRYESAEALSADVKRYLADEPVAAGPPGAAYRAKKFFRRHRRSITLALLVLVSIGIGIGMAHFTNTHHADYAADVSATQTEPGLVAELFNGTQLSKFVRQRIDRQIDFTWTHGNTPDVDMPTTRYSIRWTGILIVPPGGIGGIGAIADDGIRLKLDRANVLSFSKPQRDIYVATISPGPHAFQLEYWNTLAGGRVQLFWLRPDGQQEVIPANAFSHAEK